VTPVTPAPPATEAGGVRLTRLRWWHLDDVLRAEDELFGDEAWSAELFWSELAQPGRTWLAALDGSGRVVGYAGLARYPDEAYVQNIAVVAQAQGRGLGARLLDALLAEAASDGLTVVGLEVRADNDAAQRLYRRRGFRVVGRRRGYYQPSGADALVMVREGGGEG
jgi:ribosomal-protein-alanine N-acetyltransferase